MKIFNWLFGGKKTASVGGRPDSKNETTSNGLSVTQDDKYFTNCLEQKYKEEDDIRSWDSDPIFQKVLTPLNSGDNATACREAESIVPKFGDFADLYDWWGTALIRMGSYDKARQVLREGIEKSKKKHPLCNQLGEVEWKSRNLRDAVYWWAQGLHCQESLTNYGGHEGAYLYLHYVSLGFGLSDCAAAFLMRSDQIRPGNIRLNPESSKDLFNLASTAKDSQITEVLKGIVNKHITPQQPKKNKSNTKEVERLIRQVEKIDADSWPSDEDLAAAEKLGELGDLRAIESLTKAMRHLSIDLQIAAEEAIKKIKGAKH
jgi:tetratricopeptide (TPR) repeat protein